MTSNDSIYDRINNLRQQAYDSWIAEEDAEAKRTGMEPSYHPLSPGMRLDALGEEDWITDDSGRSLGDGLDDWCVTIDATDKVTVWAAGMPAAEATIEGASGL